TFMPPHRGSSTGSDHCSLGAASIDGLGVEAAQRQLSHKQLSTTEAHYEQRVTAGPDARAVLDEWASKPTG
ncbi:hypothetical protein K6T84_21160, partial [Mycolicibacter sp. MYC101]|nr:hypothetical protein [Mycolicibacter sp. MYC101]